MRSGPEERRAPAGAERWFFAPRNPDMPAPSKREITAAKPGPGSAATAYRGTEMPPASDSLIASGGLYPYENGMLFLPFAAAEAESWVETMRVPIDMTISAIAGVFLPLGNIFLDSARDALVSEILFGKREQAEAERKWASRWMHPGIFVVPTVNIVEAASTTIRGRGILAKSNGYLAVTAYDADGQAASYTLRFYSPCPSFAAALFSQRVRRELEFYVARAVRKIINYDDRARAGLAKLGLDISAPAVTPESILTAVEQAGEGDHSSRLDKLTVGQLEETLTEIGNAAWNETKQQLGCPVWTRC